MNLYMMKAFKLFLELYQNNQKFKSILDVHLASGKIRFFDDREWDKIKNQNFMSPIPEMKEFMDMFMLGYNIGNCVGASWQLSYSYDEINIVSGKLPILKGTLNAEKEGGHGWLETSDAIIDSTLMLVIDLSLKPVIGYIEEERLTSFQLSKMPIYQARKQFVRDPNIKR